MKQNRLIPLITMMAALREPLNISTELKGDEAIIRINGAIFQWGESSKDIQAQLKAMNGKAKKAKVYINTPGGSVFEAEEICNLIDDHFTDVQVIGGAVVASAGTIFLAKYPNKIRKNTQVMIHRPKGYPEGNVDEIESYVQLLKNVENNYVSDYAKKMGITNEQVTALWDKGDYWMNSAKAKDHKLVDEIEGEEQIDSQTRAMIEACGAPVLPPVNNTNFNFPKMNREQLIAQLGLKADASDADITAAIQKLKDAAKDAETLKAAKDTADAQAAEAKIKALLDGAEKDKKIVAAQRANYETLAKANFESTKSIIDALPVITAPSAGIKGGTPGAQDKKTYAQYQEDPTGWEELTEDEQKELIDAYFKQ